MTDVINIAVLGPTGRLGKAICKALLDNPKFKLVGGVVRSESDFIGKDLGVLVGQEPIGCLTRVSLEEAVSDATIIIDASTPAMTIMATERLAALPNKAIISGVTGFTSDQKRRLLSASSKIPVLQAGNFSLGIAVMESLVRKASNMPARDWDVEISETHHKNKTDAPSGTALMLGEAAAAGRGVSLEEAAVWHHDGKSGSRETGTIGFAVIRGGGVIGEHTVRFLSDLEEITISHRAFDRKIFANGALAAAEWMITNGKLRTAGLYSMQDVVSS